MDLSVFLGLLGIQFLFVMSPGMHFARITQLSLVKKSAAFWYLLGMMTAATLHLAFALFGVREIIETTELQLAMKISGTLVLLYFAYSSFKSAESNGNKKPTTKHPFLQSFLPSIIDIQVFLYMNLILIPLVPGTLEFTDKLWLLTLPMLTDGIWFPFIILLFQWSIVQRFFANHTKIIQRIYGVVFFVFIAIIWSV